MIDERTNRYNGKIFKKFMKSSKAHEKLNRKTTWRKALIVERKIYLRHKR